MVSLRPQIGVLIGWAIVWVSILLGPAIGFAEDTEPTAEWYEVGYDDGLFLEVCEEDGQSFRLRANVRGQFRYSGFASNNSVPPPLVQRESANENRSAFDIERARLLFSGHAFHPDLKFHTQIDGDTDGNQVLDFLDFWFSGRVNEHLTLLAGRRKIPGVRQWMLSSMDTRLVDRPVPVDFFRPDRTVGIWAFGEIGEDLHYETMVGNGYRVSNLASGEFPKAIVVAGQVLWTPLAEFGASAAPLA